MAETTDKRSEEQARYKAEHIAELVAAMTCDYGRLAELREERDTWVENDGGDEDEQNRTAEEWAKEFPDDAEELADLEKAATIDGDELDEEKARERIQEHPLSVQVRSGWYSPGYPDADRRPEEFEILLCTGGPAVRIVGELDEHLEPARAWIEHQDWGTPWTQAFNLPIEPSTLLDYCRCFYFGE